MVTLHFFVDPLQQVFRQCCIEPHGLPQIRCDVKINDSPDPTCIIGIRHMDVDFLRLRKRFVISNQTFEMKRQRLLNVLQRLSDIRTGREATWHIGNGHSVVRIGVLVQYDRKFHCAPPLMLEL